MGAAPVSMWHPASCLTHLPTRACLTRVPPALATTPHGQLRTAAAEPHSTGGCSGQNSQANATTDKRHTESNALRSPP
eukprot:2417291-Prymnesium_polylepis.2